MFVKIISPDYHPSEGYALGDWFDCSNPTELIKQGLVILVDRQGRDIRPKFYPIKWINAKGEEEESTSARVYWSKIYERRFGQINKDLKGYIKKEERRIIKELIYLIILKTGLNLHDAKQKRMWWMNSKLDIWMEEVFNTVKDKVDTIAFEKADNVRNSPTLRPIPRLRS